MNNLYTITGPAGVGKSTIYKHLAEDMRKSALIEGENCIDLIQNFINKGYDVVFNYICTPEDTEYIRSKVQNARIKLCVLMAGEETLIKRDKMRPLDCQMGKRSVVLLEEFKEMNYSRRYYLDTTL